MKRIYAVSGLSLLCAILAANVAQAQSADQPGQSASEISNLLDSFEAESVQLSEEQQDLYSDEAFNFTLDPATTEAVRRLWIPVLTEGTGSEEAAVEAEKTFGPGNVQELVDGIFSDNNFQVSNYFDVIAMELIGNMYIAQNIEGGTSTEGDRQIRDFTISAMTSEEILRQREKDNATKQQQQQVSALVTVYKMYNFFNVRNAGNPTDQLQEAARVLLADKYQIDTRFMEMTDEGIGVSQKLKDVISGETTFESVYPDLDLAELSESSESPIAQVIGTIIPKIADYRNSVNLVDDSSTQPDPVPAESTDILTEATDSAGDGGNPLADQTNESPSPKAVNPLAAKRSVFAGQFLGDGLSLSLDVNNDNATGSLVFNGQQYPVEGVVTDSTLNGVFRSGADEFPFEASADANQIRFETGDTTYTLLGE